MRNLYNLKQINVKWVQQTVKLALGTQRLLTTFWVHHTWATF